MVFRWDKLFTLLSSGIVAVRYHNHNNIVTIFDFFLHIILSCNYYIIKKCHTK